MTSSAVGSPSPDPRCRTFTGFGLAVECDFAVPGVEARLSAGPDLRICLASRDAAEGAFSGAAGPVIEAVLGDGAIVAFAPGRAGDYLIGYGENRFHLSADGALIRCAPARAEDWAWQRQLLDTVLFSAAFLSGFELLHGGAVIIDNGTVAILGTSGAGKSTLLAELLTRGHRLLADDIIALSEESEQVLGLPGPALMNLADAGPPPAAIGARRITRFMAEHESWVVVPAAATTAVPISGICLLDSGGQNRDPVEQAPVSVIDVLAHAVTLPHGAPRAAQRFALLSRLVGSARVGRISRAGRTPTEMADAVESWMLAP